MENVWLELGNPAQHGWGETVAGSIQLMREER
jgi:hypothetical protein